MNAVKADINGNASKMWPIVMYGSSFTVYSPTEILRYKDSPLTVIISAGPYSSEIRKQVSSLHPSCLIKIINLPITLDL